MKAFWHYYENEPVTGLRWCGRFNSNASTMAYSALWSAIRHVADRKGLSRDAPNAHLLEQHTEAVRDLSLAICAALERMHESVPAAESEEKQIRRIGSPVEWVKPTGTYEGWLAPPRAQEVMPKNPLNVTSATLNLPPQPSLTDLANKVEVERVKREQEREAHRALYETMAMPGPVYPPFVATVIAGHVEDMGGVKLVWDGKGWTYP